MTTPEQWGQGPSTPPPTGAAPPANPWGQPPPGGQYAAPPPLGHYQAQPPPYYGPPARAMNGMAIASMVLGILWLYWIGSVLALVFGYIAKKQIQERNESGDGMATAGIVLGWVGVGILAAVIVGVVVVGLTGDTLTFDS